MKLAADNSRLSDGFDVADFIIHTGVHGTNVPTTRLVFKLVSFYICVYFSNLVQHLQLTSYSKTTAKPHAPSKESKLWRNNTLLTWGFLVFQQAVFVQWDMKTPPTDENTPSAYLYFNQHEAYNQ